MAAPQFLFFYTVSLLLTAEHPAPACWLIGLYAMTVIRSILNSGRFR